MSFTFDYDHQPEKFLKKLDKHLALRIINKIEETLTSDSVPHTAMMIT